MLPTPVFQLIKVAVLTPALLGTVSQVSPLTTFLKILHLPRNAGLGRRRRRNAISCLGGSRLECGVDLSVVIGLGLTPTMLTQM